MSNPNAVYSKIFVDALAQSGLQHVVLSPGSRNTPLVLAFAEEDRIEKHSLLDERSAGFYALGLALASDQPVALCCTSGTAAANYFPAIIEAHQSRVPLIVLTADRPPELRHSGANQTIDQVKIYGDYALWAVEAALPEENPPAVALRNLRTTASRAYATANGLRKGVVHINMPFRKPLEPKPEEDTSIPPSELPAVFFDMPTPSEVQANHHNLLQKIIHRSAEGVIICGGGASKIGEDRIIATAKSAHYPILAEANSGLRRNEHVFTAYESYLAQAPKAEVIIRFGDVPISKALNQYILNSAPQYMVQVNHDGVWTDDSHLTTHVINLGGLAHNGSLIADTNRKFTTFYSEFAQLETTTWQTISQEIETGAYFDGAVVYDMVDLIPDNSNLFAGNSLSVRHLDQFGKLQNKRIFTYANRGASGIDGNTSTALGIGAADRNKPLVAILGDITFYHDMNGLLAVQRCGVPITIVLLNNNGGGIFHRLPIREHDPAFTDYFITAHGLDYAHAAKLYGLDFIRVDIDADNARQTFREVFSASVTGRQSTIIEVRSNAQNDLARRAAIMQAVQGNIRGTLFTG